MFLYNTVDKPSPSWQPQMYWNMNAQQFIVFPGSMYLEAVKSGKTIVAQYKMAAICQES